jgi:hypothetical protein
MTLSIRLDPTGDRAFVTERPHWAAWLLLAHDERVYEAIRDSRGVWWEIRERADHPVSWRVQRALEAA